MLISFLFLSLLFASHILDAYWSLVKKGMNISKMSKHLVHIDKP